MSVRSAMPESATYLRNAAIVSALVFMSVNMPSSLHVNWYPHSVFSFCSITCTRPVRARHGQCGGGGSSRSGHCLRSSSQKCTVIAAWRTARRVGGEEGHLLDALVGDTAREQALREVLLVEALKHVLVVQVPATT